MMISKKGQGLSLNVIIVAALALVVLVVLIVIFTGRIGSFDEGLGEEANAELIKMRIFYGKCQPGASLEETFTRSYANAVDSEQRDFASSDFRAEIDRCKEFGSDRGTCESESGCVWS